MEGEPGSVVSADGTRIGYITAGVGPALLLVHGGMCSAARWAPLWPLLVERFTVTAVDIPAAWAISTTVANVTRFSTALICARLARLTHGGSGDVGATT